MLFEDSPAPREAEPEITCARHLAVEFDDGNGMWITTGVSHCAACPLGEWCISQDYRTEGPPINDTKNLSSRISARRERLTRMPLASARVEGSPLFVRLRAEYAERDRAFTSIPLPPR